MVIGNTENREKVLVGLCDRSELNLGEYGRCQSRTCNGKEGCRPDLLEITSELKTQKSLVLKISKY